MFSPVPDPADRPTARSDAAGPGPARRAGPPPPRDWRARLRSAAWTVAALLTLAEPPTAPAATAHPHRRPLRPAPRAGRPGAARPRPQHCLVPVPRNPRVSTAGRGRRAAAR